MKRLVFWILVPLLLMTPVATASTLSFDLGYVFSGVLPSNYEPWLTAEFSDVTPGTVRLTLTAENLLAGEFISEFYFNTDPNNLMLPAQLALTNFSGVASSAFAKGENAFQADGDGKYDALISFPTGNNEPRFTGANSSAVFTLTGDSIGASSFNFESDHKGGNGIYHVAAHVQGIKISGSTETTSAWIGDGTSDLPRVPEPAGFLLVGTALIAVGWVRRSRTH